MVSCPQFRFESIRPIRFTQGRPEEFEGRQVQDKYFQTDAADRKEKDFVCFQRTIYKDKRLLKASLGISGGGFIFICWFTYTSFS